MLTLAIPANGRAGLCTGTAAQYVIITKADWVSAFDGYVISKNNNGLTTRVFTTEAIATAYAGATLQDKVRAFITDAYATWSISYVLFGGDESVIPFYNAVNLSDKFYFDLDSDPYSGSVAVLGGRLPGTTLAQVQTMANYWAAYDGSAAWTRTAVFCGWLTNHLNSFSKLQPVELGEGVIPFTIVSQINGGIGVLGYYGHGSDTTWGQVNYLFSHNQYLTNGSQCPFVYAAACLTGKLDAPYSIAESFFKTPHGGAIGYIGAYKEITFGSAGGMINALTQGMQTQYFDNGRINFSALYYFYVGTSEFTFLGDPTAEWDLRLDNDQTPPIINDRFVGPSTAAAYQNISITAVVTDNDEVSSHVWAQITGPDASVDQCPLTRIAGSSSFTGIYAATGLTGDYQVRVQAQDISGNKQTDSQTLTVTVNADTQAPVILSATADKSLVAPMETVWLQIQAQDNSNGDLTIQLDITQPDATIVTQIVASQGALNYPFSNTSQAGRYQVHVLVTDPSGNTASSQLVTTFPDTAFEVMADSTPPVIQGGWITSGFLTSSTYREYEAKTVGQNDFFTIYMDVADDATQAGMMTCTMTVMDPSGQALSPMVFWMGTGVYPAGSGYMSEQLTAMQAGFYQITVQAQDQVGKTSVLTLAPFSVYRSPGNLLAVAGDQQASLAWTAASAGYPITGYNVLRSTVSHDSNTLVANALPLTTTSYTDLSGLTNNTSYFYRVIALDSMGNTCGSTAEVEVMPTAGFVLPSAPLTVQVQAHDQAVQLNWQPALAGSNPVAGYQVYRGLSPNGQTPTPVNVNVISGLSYTDSTLVNGMVYYYKLTTLDSLNNESPYSNEASVTPLALPSTVNDLAASAINEQVVLTWHAPSAGTYALENVVIFRALVPHSATPVKLTTVAKNTQSFTDVACSNGIAYYYYLVANDSQGNSSLPSNEVQATPNLAYPSAPQGLTLTASTSSLIVNWTHNAVDEEVQHYVIYRGLIRDFVCDAGHQVGQVIYNEFTLPQFEDTTVQVPITYYYKLTATNSRGQSNSSAAITGQLPAGSGPTASATRTPRPAVLDHVTAYPNPCRDRVTFVCPQTDVQDWTIVVYNLTGDKVAYLRQDDAAAGMLEWSCASLAPGLYYYLMSYTQDSRSCRLGPFKIAVLK